MNLEGFSGTSRSTSGMGLVRFKIQSKAMAYLRGCVFVLVLVSTNAWSTISDSPEEQFTVIDPIISKPKPERPHGRGFKLEYVVSAPLDEFWSFKTNFDNDLLRKNKFINSHKLVSREENLVITETEYSYKPKSIFKWQTTVLPQQNLLEYELLNPEECDQKYHYGSIQLEAEGNSTRVTHIAYFDFFGVTFWVNYPFKGGMSDFLKYTALWEQEFVSDFKNQHQK